MQARDIVITDELFQFIYISEGIEIDILDSAELNANTDVDVDQDLDVEFYTVLLEDSSNL